MKFPLRLSLDLLRTRASRVFSNDHANGTIFHLSPAVFSTTDQKEIEAESDPGAAVMEIPASVLSRTAAPVFWVGGEEPLQHPVIGRIAGALNQAGRNVFLHTNGEKLRQRIHEFRPDARLFLTVELAGREAAHDLATGRPGSFRRVIEGIRAAKLSGFHVCAHVTAKPDSNLCEIGELFESLDNYGVDGYIVSSGGLMNDPAISNKVRAGLDEMRALIRCSRWEYFSSLLEDSYTSTSRIKIPATIRGTDPGVFEESA
jgi:MoaA/NifB/PqqE/SkfB family radical SAM enzyme